MAWTDLFHFHYNGSFNQCWIQKLAGTTTKLIIKVSALSMKISYQCPWKIGAWTTFSRGENESHSFRPLLSRSLASIFFSWNSNIFEQLKPNKKHCTISTKRKGISILETRIKIDFCHLSLLIMQPHETKLLCILFVFIQRQKFLILPSR